MKHLLKNALMICFLALGLGFMAAPQVEAELSTATVSVSPTKLTLAVGETTSLQVSAGAISWSSSDPSVVRVSKGGVLKAMGTGNAVITAKLNKSSATCKVTVIDAFMGHYTKYLDNLEDSDSKARYFALVDMEQDGFPELVTATVLEKDILYNVYTVKNKTVKNMGFYASSKKTDEVPKVYFSAKHHSLVADWTNEENTSHTLTLYKMKKNKLKIGKQLLHYIEDDTLLEVYETGTKGKRVTEQEAKDYEEKYFMDYAGIVMQENTTKNRKAVFGR